MRALPAAPPSDNNHDKCGRMSLLSLSDDGEERLGSSRSLPEEWEEIEEDSETEQWDTIGK